MCRATFAILGILTACDGGSSSSPSSIEPDAMEAVSDAPAATWTSTPGSCSDTLDVVYAAVPAPGALLWTVLACWLGPVLDTAQAQVELESAGAGDVIATTGVQLVKLAYQTIRSDGAPAVSSAVLYLPVAPRALPAPVALIGRSTAGLADTCAPSLGEFPHGALALPLAARGYVAIAPDFSGLGTEGVHSYLDNHESARQLFDAHLAARAVGAPGLVGPAVAALGYSQGGGIVLSAQGLEHELTGQRTLQAVVALAPAWHLSTRSFGYEGILRSPDTLTGLAGLSPPTVTVLRHYGFLVNRMGLTGEEAFPSEERGSIASAVNSLCTVELGASLGFQQRWQRELVDAEFRAQVLACVDGTSGCTGLGAAFADWLEADRVTADPQGARVLIAQGLADQVMPASREAACIVDKLRADGVEPALCLDALATHQSVVDRTLAEIVGWIDATVDGTTPPACAPVSLPDCSQ